MDVKGKDEDFIRTLRRIVDVVQTSVVAIREGVAIYRDYIEVLRAQQEIEHLKIFIEADKLGIAASPQTLWLEILSNTRNKGIGFSGWITNGAGSLEQQALNQGISPQQLATALVAPELTILKWAQNNQYATAFLAPEIIVAKWLGMK